ncbi:glycosyltransferase family 9 protein [Beijerinckia indica]|uniref:Glycosyl transferase family 9 n=1 Tax=Beijerinckia indica subsp. indica (strain ATCC 9039 / DSM 1715 / NCIMB 8712) TaxID=395963 RepID=B2ILK6_BEII9|nr:glycosyltransferase family 9 protein [Beijerinckia indica]ACB97406.1 glycosyl transferase family 9 [Beijerinckia indica subsp. indica ATCC 9039]
MKSIGIFQHWGLGDLLMTVPVLSELRRLHPAAQIVLIVRGKAQAALLAKSPLIDKILEVPPNSEKLDLLRFFWSLRQYHFEAVYIGTRITPLVPLLLRLVTGVSTIIGDGNRLGWLYTHRNTIDPAVHRVDRMLQTLSLWTGHKVEEPDFPLPIAEEPRRLAMATLEAQGLTNARFFTIHPGSSRGPGIEKRVPVRLVKDVIAGLRKYDPDLRFVILFGPDDQDLIPSFTPPEPGISLISGASLDETKFVLSRSWGFLGSDSALGHIAASAYNVPTITPIGPTNPLETHPYNALSRIVQSREEFDCRPCWFTPLQGNCPHAARCMTTITVDQILDVVATWPKHRISAKSAMVPEPGVHAAE